jgi:alpha-L-fucosidase
MLLNPLGVSESGFFIPSFLHSFIFSSPSFFDSFIFHSSFVTRIIRHSSKSPIPMRICLLSLFIFSTAFAQKLPVKPFGAVPNSQQVAWHKMEYYGFLHFNMNTFTNNEWGHGDENPDLFNPTQLDTDQWVRIAKAAGMKALILTAKHHDGFSLWPSKQTTHSVAASKWRNGHGDVVKELAQSCRKYGLKMGIYLSPWDRNHPTYGTDGYNQVFANTLKEVLTQYGKIFEVWFDGANGEGPNGKKQVYDWGLFERTVRRYQPDATIFSGIPVPDIRWIGNEAGMGNATNWNTFNPDQFQRGIEDAKELGAGHEDGGYWIPAEADVSIRPGWYYHAAEDTRVKSISRLLNIYYASIGHGANLLLNIPIDRRGKVHPADSSRLMQFHQVISTSFANNLGRGKAISASNTKLTYQTSALTDQLYGTYWVADDKDETPSLEMHFGKATSFNRLVMQEYIPLGQRVKAWSASCGNNGTFTPIAEATTVGYKRILRFPIQSCTDLKIQFTAVKAAPVLSEMQVFLAPEMLTEPRMVRDKDGNIQLLSDSPEQVMTYTLDGSEPTASSALYSSPIKLPKGGTVKAKAFINNFSQASATISSSFDMAPSKWKVVFADNTQTGWNPENTIDGNMGTYWFSSWEKDGKPYPHELQIDLGETLDLKGFTYMPQPDDHRTGNVAEYAYYVSTDGQNWGEPVSKGIFGNILNNPIEQKIRFDQSHSARFIRFVMLRPADPKHHWAAVAELGIITN